MKSQGIENSWCRRWEGVALWFSQSVAFMVSSCCCCCCSWHMKDLPLAVSQQNTFLTLSLPHLGKKLFEGNVQDTAYDRRSQKGEDKRGWDCGGECIGESRGQGWWEGRMGVMMLSHSASSIWPSLICSHPSYCPAARKNLILILVLILLLQPFISLP